MDLGDLLVGLFEWYIGIGGLCALYGNIFSICFNLMLWVVLGVFGIWWRDCVYVFWDVDGWFECNFCG